MTGPLPLSLAVKLGSLAVHVQEMIDTAQGALHGTAEVESADLNPAGRLAYDPEVVAWLASFTPALLPVKRAEPG